MEWEKVYLKVVKEGVGVIFCEKKIEFLFEIIECLNDFFVGENFIEGDMFSYVNIICIKVEENEEVME